MIIELMMAPRRTPRPWRELGCRSGYTPGSVSFQTTEGDTGTRTARCGRISTSQLGPGASPGLLHISMAGSVRQHHDNDQGLDQRVMPSLVVDTPSIGFWIGTIESQYYISASATSQR